MTDEEAKSRVSKFLSGSAGVRHALCMEGPQLGLDRIVMILAGAESLREVIPFPKTARAGDLMVDAPTPDEREAVERVQDCGEEIAIAAQTFRLWA